MDRQGDVTARRVAELQDRAWESYLLQRGGLCFLFYFSFGFVLAATEFFRAQAIAMWWILALLGGGLLIIGVFQRLWAPPLGRFGRPWFEEELQREGATEEFNSLFVEATAQGFVDESLRAVCCECVARYGHVPQRFESYLTADVEKLALAYETRQLWLVLPEEISPEGVAAAMRKMRRREYMEFASVQLILLFGSVFLVALLGVTAARMMGWTLPGGKTEELLANFMWFAVPGLLLLLWCVFGGAGSWRAVLTFSGVVATMRKRVLSADFHKRMRLAIVGGKLPRETQQLVHTILTSCPHLPLYMRDDILPALEKAEQAASQDQVATTCAEGLAKRLQQEN